MNIHIDDNGKYIFSSSTLSWGNMSSKYVGAETAVNNRRQFISSLGIDYDSDLSIRAGHSSNIEISNPDGSTFRINGKPTIDTDFPEYLTGVDGRIRRYYPSSLSLVSGDCIPLAVYSNSDAFIGLFHVGLLGVLNNFIEQIIVSAETCNVNIASLRFLIGPNIPSSCLRKTRSTWIRNPPSCVECL